MIVLSYLIVFYCSRDELADEESMEPPDGSFLGSFFEKNGIWIFLALGLALLAYIIAQLIIGCRTRHKIKTTIFDGSPKTCIKISTESVNSYKDYKNSSSKTEFFCETYGQKRFTARPELQRPTLEDIVESMELFFNNPSKKY